MKTFSKKLTRRPISVKNNKLYYLLHTVIAYTAVLLVITLTTFFVVWAISPAILNIVASSLNIEGEIALRALQIVIIVVSYNIIIFICAFLLLKTNKGNALLNWFIATNKNIGIDLSREAIEKRIQNFGSRKN